MEKRCLMLLEGRAPVARFHRDSHGKPVAYAPKPPSPAEGPTPDRLAQLGPGSILRTVSIEIKVHRPARVPTSPRDPRLETYKPSGRLEVWDQ